MISPKGFKVLAIGVAIALPIALLSLPAIAAAAQDVPVAAGSATGTDPYLAPQGNGGYDVAEYDVELSYADESHGIAAAAVTVTAKSTQELRQFSLDARTGLDIESVRVDGAKASFKHRHDKLIIKGFGTIERGQRFRTQIRYSGDPVAVQDRSGRGKFGWLPTRRGAVTYTEPTGTSTWLPSNDVFYDKAKWRITLSSPKDLMGVSSGTFLGARSHHGRTITKWRQGTPIQPYAQVVAFDRFDYSTKPIAGIPAFTAVAEQSGVTVAQMRTRTGRALDWLIPRLGDYPFGSTGGIVVGGADSAMETAGRPTYSSGAWNTSMATVLHEHAHQWFGNTLTATNARDIWLHEGFATYLENIETAERTHRPLGDIVHEQYVWDGWGAKWRGQFGEVSLHQPTMRYLLNTTPYYRGQAALHALRTLIGDATFWKVMRDLADQPAGHNSTTPEVIAEAEAASGRDLSGWARDWVYSVDPQRLPDAPTHETVIQEVGPFLLDAAGDYVWDPRGKPLKQMQRAEKSWQPLDQLQVTKVTSMKRGKRVRYFVDFQTKVGVIYPAAYPSCLVFERHNAEILSGSLIGVRLSSKFEQNRFTPRACSLIWS